MKGFGAISNLANWAFTLSDSVFKMGEKLPKGVTERLPGFGGFSKEDERLFEAMRIRLTPDEDDQITLFLRQLKVYEVNSFRLVVSGMPYETKTITTEEDSDDPQKKGKKKKRTESVDWPLGTDFLKRIAQMVKDEGVEKAYERCVSGGTILENPLHQKILNKWRKIRKTTETKLLKLFGVSSFSELLDADRFKKAMERADDKLIGLVQVIEENESKRKEDGWFKRIFWPSLTVTFEEKKGGEENE